MLSILSTFLLRHKLCYVSKHAYRPVSVLLGSDFQLITLNIFSVRYFFRLTCQLQIPYTKQVCYEMDRIARFQEMHCHTAFLLIVVIIDTMFLKFIVA
jgi:hypothetical protein